VYSVWVDVGDAFEIDESPFFKAYELHR